MLCVCSCLYIIIIRWPGSGCSLIHYFNYYLVRFFYLIVYLQIFLLFFSWAFLIHLFLENYKSGHFQSSHWKLTLFIDCMHPQTRNENFCVFVCLNMEYQFCFYFFSFFIFLLPTLPRVQSHHISSQQVPCFKRFKCKNVCVAVVVVVEFFFCFVFLAFLEI